MAAAGLYKALVREWCVDARPVPLPPRYREPKSPIMHVRNAAFSSDVFRKVHVEYAHTGKVDIVHHTAFPHSHLDLPILGMDVVFRDGAPSMVIADLSSDQVREPWAGLLPQLLELYEAGGTRRALPEWGRRIFSDDYLFWNEPSGNVSDMLLHLRASYAAGCVIFRHHRRDMSEFHATYCANQLENQKTRGMLAGAFGMTFADAYMRDVMFDM